MQNANGEKYKYLKFQIFSLRILVILEYVSCRAFYGQTFVNLVYKDCARDGWRVPRLTRFKMRLMHNLEMDGLEIYTMFCDNWMFFSPPFSWNWSGGKFQGRKLEGIVSFDLGIYKEHVFVVTHAVSEIWAKHINGLILAAHGGSFVSYLVHSFYVPLCMYYVRVMKIGHSHWQILTAANLIVFWWPFWCQFAL